MSWFSWLRNAESKKNDSKKRKIAFLSGRRYMTNIPYILPKDLGEINRLDFQHYMLRHHLRSNFLAPISHPRDILDVGSGTGRWAEEVAQQFPSANVLSMDIEPPQHHSSYKAENCVFVQGNVLNDLPFPDKSFDFVHQRLLVLAVPSVHWPNITKELFRVTRPEGWIELVEASFIRGSGLHLKTLQDWVAQFSLMRGIDVLMSYHIDTLLQNIGLTNIQFREITIPIGPGSGRVGAMAEKNYESIFLGLKGAIVNSGITDESTYEYTRKKAFEEIQDGKSIVPYFAAYGQRLK